MKRLGPRLRKGLFACSALAAVAIAYWLGYRAGLDDKGPQYHVLVVTTKGASVSNPVGSSHQFFDVSNPLEAARLRAEEARLKAIGADCYVTKARVETSLMLAPDPRHVRSHR